MSFCVEFIARSDCILAIVTLSDQWEFNGTTKRFNRRESIKKTFKLLNMLKECSIQARLFPLNICSDLNLFYCTRKIDSCSWSHYRKHAYLHVKIRNKTLNKADRD